MKDNVNELLIERLKEKGLNPEDFKDVLDVIKQPKYGLIWEDHPEHIEERMKYNRPVLREEKELRIDSGYGYTNNILMEGDNLASLIAMREAGKKVDVIYIDPPYNTGNEFVYNDKIVDKEDSFRHSKWLSFMEKRLKVARDLMTDDGVIFVSIDDNEQANLKLLMDEVFGEENFLSTIHWRKNRKPHNAGNTMSTSYEFIHVYYKKNRIKLVKNFDNDLKDEHGSYNIYPIIQGDKKLRTYVFKKGLYVQGVLKKGIIKSSKNELLNIEILDDPIVKDGILCNDIRITGRFRLTDVNGRLSEAINNNRIFFNTNGIPKEKRYRLNDSKKLDNHHWDIDFGKYEDANNDIVDIFKKSVFNYSKPKELIKRCLKSYNKSNVKVLDFFAGSGTTGHAVLELNKEDGGHRQFILCTNNENNICRDVTYERLRRVINGYTTPKGKEVEGLPANLMYLTVSDTPKENNDVMFDMDENEPLRPHIINNLRLKYHLHHPDELVENLYRLRNGNTVHYVYFNDYIEDGVEEAILDSLDRDKTNIMHTVEGLVHDEVFNMMDDIKDIAGLLNE